MSAVVVLSKKCDKNPDHIAPAVAASFGDLTTLALLALCASLFQAHPGKLLKQYAETNLSES